MNNAVYLDKMKQGVSFAIIQRIINKILRRQSIVIKGIIFIIEWLVFHYFSKTFLTLVFF